MTFLSPWFLAAGAAAAGAIVLLHFLARRRPRPAVLPTARFVPDDPARWPSRAPRPTDWLLLVLRVLAVLVVAVGFAQPVREAEHVLTTRLLLVDRSRATGEEQAMRDSVRSLLREGDVVIAFDTTATAYPHLSDSAPALVRSAAPASLSAALIAAERAAHSLRERADSLELVLISSFPDGAWDAATADLRARWAGRARLVRLPPASDDTMAPIVDVRADAWDPVRAAVAHLPSEGETTVRVVRETPLQSDSAWVRSSRRVLVHWPRDTGEAALSAQAVVTEDVVLAAPLARRPLEAEGGLIIARFADGSPAAVERTHGDGCVREVAFDFPRAGDVPLRESARRVATRLVVPCEQHATHSAMDSARLDSLRGQGALLATSSLPPAARQRSRLTSWLLLIGALLLLAEVAARPRALRT